MHLMTPGLHQANQIVHRRAGDAPLANVAVRNVDRDPVAVHGIAGEVRAANEPAATTVAATPTTAPQSDIHGVQTRMSKQNLSTAKTSDMLMSLTGPQELCCLLYEIALGS